MARGRNDEWGSSREVYSASEVESVLKSLGLDVVEETENDFLSLCPYHGNTDSPAFSTSKRYGFSVCFNPSCAVGTEFRLTLEKLVRDIKGLDAITAKRFVSRSKGASGETFAQKFDSINSEPEVLPEFSSSAILVMKDRLFKTDPAMEYLKGRGFTRETIDYFNVGFTPATTGYGAPVYRPYDMVVVPAYDQKGRPVGLVGRSIVGKMFKNYGPGPGGKGFHKSQILWNLNNAKRYDTVIICESTFDAMRIHQAGYPNVVALLGGSLSEAQGVLLSRYFNNIVIFTDSENADNDEMTYHRRCVKCLRQKYDMCQGHAPGRDLGMKIAESLPRMRILWATYDDKHVYANNVKDAAAMTDDQIRQCLRNSISHYEYLEWVA